MTNSTSTDTQIFSDFLPYITAGLAIALTISIILNKTGKGLRDLRQLSKEVKNDATLSQEQKKTEKKIVKDVDSAKDKLNEQIGFNAFPYDLDIQWTDGSKSKVDLDKENNRVIAILKNEDTSAESFARATHFYCKDGLMPDIKKHLPRNASNAVDLTMTKKILNLHRPDSIEFFEDEIMKENQKGNKTIKNYCVGLGTLDDKGQFTRVFLRELYEIGKQLSQVEPNKFISEELEEFVEYCVKWSRKKENEKLDEPFIAGRHVRFAVFPIADPQTKQGFNAYLHNLSKSPYGKHLKFLIDQNIHSIYIMARGQSNIKFTKAFLGYVKGFEQVADIQQFPFKHPYDQFPTFIARVVVKPANF